MINSNTRSFAKFRTPLMWLVLVLMAGVLVPGAYAKKKDKEKEAEKAKQEQAAAPAEPSEAEMRKEIDVSKLQWPAAPEIARIKFQNELFGEKPKPQDQQEQPKKKKKQGWMDRMAGVTVEEKRASKKSTVDLLLKPYGVAVDSKGRIYTADMSVGAVFIFDEEKKDLVGQLKNGAPFQWKTIVGLAIDDSDRVFVTDSEMHLITAINKDGQPEDTFGLKELKRPSGAAIDNENRFLYIADVDRSQIAVFDADSFKFLRYIGSPPKFEGDDEEGTLDKPTNVAVDEDGYLYVADTLNNRIQIFDADGEFVDMFGKQGVEPGTFARPKGVAIDSDGHVWVADANQNRIQIFDKKGRLRAYFGTKGQWPGQFFLPAGIATDNKNNRVIVSDQWKGRLQVFKYITESEAAAAKAEKEKKRMEKAGGKGSAAASDKQEAKAGEAPQPASPSDAAQTPPSTDKPEGGRKGKMPQF
jgi:DNA-binding beta-propeller fold protein YncE